MMHLSMICRAAPLALVLMAACEPARTLHPATTPAPVYAPAVALTPADEAMLDAMLKVHFGDRPVAPEARERFRRLMAVALATPAPAASSTPPRPSREVERALRELQASAGTTEDMQRILRRYVAETQAAEPRQP